MEKEAESGQENRKNLEKGEEAGQKIGQENRKKAQPVAKTASRAEEEISSKGVQKVNFKNLLSDDYDEEEDEVEEDNDYDEEDEADTGEAGDDEDEEDAEENDEEYYDTPEEEADAHKELLVAIAITCKKDGGISYEVLEACFKEANCKGVWLDSLEVYEELEKLDQEDSKEGGEESSEEDSEKGDDKEDEII
jgi:hypothetical protein